jgi:nickel-dependent lactate racemase
MNTCVDRFAGFSLFAQLHTMAFTLRYGLDSLAELELADGALVAQCGVPEGKVVEDPEGTVATALAEPLEFPPLRQATIPGDHVVLALEHALPQAPRIVSAVVEVLLEADVEPDDIVVLRTSADVRAGAEDPLLRVSEPVRQRIKLLEHDPEDSGSLAYLAATEAGQPIFLNRAITDADVVLPIGSVQSEAAADYYGVYNPVFPAFSDQQTLRRYRGQAPFPNRRGRRRRFVDEVGEVGWLLGAAFSIQVVPGPGDRILDVLAGEVGCVGRRARQLYNEAWSWSVPRQASLVVAAVEGGPVHQSWHSFGRALEVARPLVEDGGAIAVCSSLAAEPGPALRQLAAARWAREALGQIEQHPPEDAVPALQLARAQQRSRVYLLSGLDESLVEELDMVPLAEPCELARLAGRHASCILLSNAPHATVSVREEGSEVTAPK